MIKSKYYSLILLTFVWFLILFFGCAAPILDYSKLTYRAPEFQSDQLFKGGFAQLPSVARPGLAYLEEPVDNLLETKLAELGENLNAVPLEHTKEDLRDPLIKDKFNSITRAYFTRTQVDSSAVSSLSRSIGEHFMLFIYIEILEQNWPVPQLSTIQDMHFQVVDTNMVIQVRLAYSKGLLYL